MVRASALQHRDDPFEGYLIWRNFRAVSGCGLPTFDICQMAGLALRIQLGLGTSRT
jgi:hypothetical protein